MTITGLNFNRIAGYAFVCGAMLSLSIGTLQAQAPASPAPATAAAPASAPAPAKSTLTIHLTGFGNAKGKVNIDLFRDGKGFPLDPAGVVESERLEIAIGPSRRCRIGKTRDRSEDFERHGRVRRSAAGSLRRSGNTR